MNKIFAISFINQKAFLLEVEKKRDHYTVLNSIETTIQKLSSYLKSKKNLYLALELKFEITEEIKVPLAITNKQNIKKYIYYQLKETYKDITPFFNFEKLEEKNDEENALYRVEIIDEVELLKTIEIINDFNKISSITTNRFSLLNVANRCLKLDNYICAFAIKSKIIVIAAKDKKLIFSREIDIDIEQPDMINLNVSDSIIQTISYINTQFRDIHFDTVALSGFIVFEETISEKIFNTLIGFKIVTIHPIDYFKKIEPKKIQNYILSLGSIFIPKSQQFLPKKVLGIKQFFHITNALISISVAGLLSLGYIVYGNYQEYSKILNTNHVLQSKYISILKNAKILPKKVLDNYENHIYLVKKYLSNNPLNILIKFKPIIDLCKVVDYDFSYKDNQMNFSIKLQNNFSTLMELYNFKNSIDKKLNTIDKNLSYKKSSFIDYEKLQYNLEIKSTQIKNVKKIVRRR